MTRRPGRRPSSRTMVADAYSEGRIVGRGDARHARRRISTWGPVVLVLAILVAAFASFQYDVPGRLGWSDQAEGPAAVEPPPGLELPELPVRRPGRRLAHPRHRPAGQGPQGPGAVPLRPGPGLARRGRRRAARRRPALRDRQRRGHPGLHDEAAHHRRRARVARPRRHVRHPGRPRRHQEGRRARRRRRPVPDPQGPVEVGVPPPRGPRHARRQDRRRAQGRRPYVGPGPVRRLRSSPARPPARPGPRRTATWPRRSPRSGSTRRRRRAATASSPTPPPPRQPSSSRSCGPPASR